MNENCLVHDKPHQTHGQCQEYRRVYEQASDDYIKTRSGTTMFRLPYDLRQCEWDDARWPEPHAGISGTQREEDSLLDLDERSLATRKIIAALANAFNRALLVGPSAPQDVQRLRDRFTSSWSDDTRGPQIGDLVIETTAMYHYSDEKLRTGLGILLDKRLEWACTKEEYEEALDRERAYYEDNPEDFEPMPRTTDTVWYIQYGHNPEAVCRWTDCSFTALPISSKMVMDVAR